MNEKGKRALLLLKKDLLHPVTSPGRRLLVLRMLREKTKTRIRSGMKTRKRRRTSSTLMILVGSHRRNRTLQNRHHSKVQRLLIMIDIIMIIVVSTWSIRVQTEVLYLLTVSLVNNLILLPSILDI